MSHRPLMLGAVAYDPKVVTIWEGFAEWFATRDLAFDFILYSNYERQVEGHFAGEYDVAWNSPLAWLQARRVAEARGREAKAVAMRDTDQDLTSLVVTRADTEITSVADLKGKRVGVGARDSPQATLIPLVHLFQQGMTPDEDFTVRHFDTLVGKHGDHIGGERDAAKALMAGEVDACCIIDGNHLLFKGEGTLPHDTVVVSQTPTYDHCCFTVLDDAPEPEVGRFVALLLEMSYADPEVRPLLDLEGLKAWKPGRTSGFDLLEAAVDQFGHLDRFMAHMAERA